MVVKKIVSHLKWFFALIPLGLFAIISAPLIYPFAFLIELVCPNYNPLWWWLDDEIENDETNSDWIVYCNSKPNNLIHLYRWHAFRNTMWNLKELIKPESARVNCHLNHEKIVEVLTDNLFRNGLKLDIHGECLEMAAYRWIDKNGNEGWQVNRGVKISTKYSNIGKSSLWYTANGKLYFRYSIAKEIKLFSKTFYYQFRMGASHERYLLILKIS